MDKLFSRANDRPNVTLDETGQQNL